MGARLKNVLKKLIIYTVPFLLLLGIFFAFEPYDYFFLRGDSEYLCKPLSSVRELLMSHPSNIILGDSRMANLNMDLVEEITGERYTMLGFGGAQTGELIELFWYAAEHTELKKVMFGINLYSTIGEQTAGRIPSVIEQAENPGKFILNAAHWLEALNVAKTKALNRVWDLTGHPERKEFPEDPTDYTAPQNVPTEMGEKYRLDIEEYREVIRTNFGSAPAVEDKTVDELKKIVAYCEEKGIDLVFVYPPMHASIYELYEELDILKEGEKYKGYLRTAAKVCDFEFLNEFTQNDDNFYDGYHLQNPLKPYLAQVLFTDMEAECIRRTTP